MGWNLERGRVNLDWEMEKQDSFHNEYRSIKKKKNLRIGMMLAVEGGFVELGDRANGGDVGGGAEGGFVELGDGVEGGDVGGGTEGGGAKWSSTRIWD